MEWQEKGIEAVFIGIIGFIGTLFVRKFKPVWKELKRMSRLTDMVDDLNKKAEIAEKRLRAVLYSSYDPIFISNSEGEVEWVNPAWLQMTGMRTDKDAFGYGYLNVIPDEDREDVKENSKTFSEYPSSFEGKVRFKHFITGEIIHTICRTEPVEYGGVLVETIGRLTIIQS